MAPTSTSTSSASKNTVNANPAPDFTVNMNRIQTQFEAHLKAVRAFLPSRSDLNNTSSSSGANPNPNPNPTSSSTGKSFSALSTSANSTVPQSRDAPSATAARRAAQEAEFAEEQALDPNAGLGHVRAPGGSNKNGNDGGGKDPETARLRGRLLGKRGRVAGADVDGQQKRVRKDESSDEEPGRSGLGRAKRIEKRSRAEMEDDGDGAKQDDGVPVETDTPPEVKVAAVEEAQESIDSANGPDEAVENATFELPGEDEPNGHVAEGNSKKKRKKKKKKKSKDKTGDD
ncbi:hypothetical protein K449DRAFT_191971 [Hypoxylon sp. EC38]|nr:hypothetical protein K449DRAFT_191971 [Hypoxylon sp. EC38]